MKSSVGPAQIAEGKPYNILIAGVGGQGVLTLASVMADAAFREGHDVKTTELHGLSQRYGSVHVHVRFGPKVYSPTMLEGSADLVVGLEPLEALKAIAFGRKGYTVFVIDDHPIVPISAFLEKKSYPSMKRVAELLKDYSKYVFPVNASAIALDFGDRTMANTYILGYLLGIGILPFRKDTVLTSMRSSIPRRFHEINEKVLERALSETLGPREVQTFIRHGES